MSPLAGGLAAAGICFGLSSLVRSGAMAAARMDMPNERSSHAIPVPRGGGASILLSLVCVLLLGQFANATARTTSMELGCVVLIGVLGWWDDRTGGISARMRLMWQLIVSFAIAAIIPSALGPFGAAGTAAAVFWSLWSVASINVWNFADGIDGMIAAQATVFGLAAAAFASEMTEARLIAAVFCGSIIGFLPFNWSPARIFLGDVGSYTIGCAAVIVGRRVATEAGVDPTIVFLPLLPMFADALVTLGMRTKAGRIVGQAHRDHLYQRLVQAGWPHSRVAVIYALMAAVGGVLAHLLHDLPAVAVSIFAIITVVVGSRLHRRASPLAHE